MLKIADLDAYIGSEFGVRLLSLGFRQLGPRKWIRSHCPPIRELFELVALKGGQYSPIWGLSSGIVPSFRNRSFRQQTDRNAVMDLTIDPIDFSGAVPKQAFRFVTGNDSTIPIAAIRDCASHFIPKAVADFERARSVYQFCDFFLERSQLKYRRFSFDMYVQHQLAHGFVLILTGHREDGLQKIKQFCTRTQTEYENRVLLNCIRDAHSYAAA